MKNEDNMIIHNYPNDTSPIRLNCCPRLVKELLVKDPLKKKDDSKFWVKTPIKRDKICTTLLEDMRSGICLFSILVLRFLLVRNRVQMYWNIVNWWFENLWTVSRRNKSFHSFVFSSRDRFHPSLMSWGP